MMRFLLLPLLVSVLSALNASSTTPAGTDSIQPQKIYFTENKGQVCDQDNKSCPDVLFSGRMNGMVYHLRNKGISYQLNRIDSWRTLETSAIKERQKVADQISIQRVDIHWLHSNNNSIIIKESAEPGYSNFYLPHCPDGIQQVKSYKKLTYQNLFEGIDLIWYGKDGQLKYDYHVSKGADYRQIQMEIQGAEQISITYAGELLILTPLGNIVEQAPVVLQNGKTLRSRWVLKNNVVSYEIDSLNSTLPFVIDPGVRVWGTYYGGSGMDYGNSCATNTLGDVYMTGVTGSGSGTTIATSGAHQTTIASTYDAYLVKFSSAGVRLWGTYCGGANDDFANTVVLDPSGDPFIAGFTNTSSGPGIATTGAHQTTFGGGVYDAFLVKFDAAGVRQWGTYYGGTGYETSYVCATSSLGEVYMSGSSSTTLSSIMTTSGAYQTTFGGSFDAFLVKFDGTGLRLWSTYYGGSGFDEAYYMCTATTGEVYLAGSTQTGTGSVMVSTGAHQTTFAGGVYDAYLAKFNSSGVRLWSTYYGGSAADHGNGCATDAAGNVYLAGVTQSTNTGVIATSGAHQTSFAGGTWDKYLVKFNSTGVRQWGTYFGGTGFEGVMGCITKSNGDVFLCGNTNSSVTPLSTPGAWQTTFAGLGDATLVGFNTNGVCLWATYYGGTGGDEGRGLCTDAQGNIYLTGVSTTTVGTAIASAGSHQSQWSGNMDGFLARFGDCTSPPPPLAGPGHTLCSGNQATVNASISTGTIQWFTSPNFTAAPVNSGSQFITGTLTAGTNTVYAGAFTCGSSITRAAVILTVDATPTVVVASGSMCAGASFTMVPTGASTYIFLNGGPVVSPAVSSVFSITGSSALGCTAAATTATVVVNALPILSVNSGTICAGNVFSFVPTGAFTYIYSGGSSAVAPLANTVYTITGNSIQGCTAHITATVFVDPTPTVQMSGGNICPGESFTLTPSGGSNYTYSPAGPVVSPSVTTIYTVSTSNSFGCTGKTTASILLKNLPIIIVASSTATICENENAVLSASGAVSYVWNTGSQSDTTMVKPLVNTTYTVTGTGSNGCTKTEMVTLYVNPCTNLNDLEIPTINIYPNPTSGKITVEVLNDNETEFILSDILGRIMYVAYGRSPCALDLADYSNGIYFVRTGNIIRKVLKE